MCITYVVVKNTCHWNFLLSMVYLSKFKVKVFFVKYRLVILKMWVKRLFGGNASLSQSKLRISTHVHLFYLWMDWGVVKLNIRVKSILMGFKPTTFESNICSLTTLPGLFDYLSIIYNQLKNEFNNCIGLI